MRGHHCVAGDFDFHGGSRAAATIAGVLEETNLVARTYHEAADHLAQRAIRLHERDLGAVRDHAVVVERPARVIDAAAGQRPSGDGAVTGEPGHRIGFKTAVDDLRNGRRVQFVVAEAVDVNRVTLELVEVQRHRDIRCNVAIGKRDAVVVAEMILVNGQPVIADAEGRRTRAILPADGVDGRDILGTDLEADDGEALRGTAVEEVIRHRAAAIVQIVAIVGEHVGQAGGGELVHHGRISASDTGERDAVDGRARRVGEVVGMCVGHEGIGNC